MFCKHGIPALALPLVLLSGFATSSLRAQASDPSTLLQRVQRWLDGTRDLQGRFEQSLVSGALGAGLTESGEFFLERPGRMRWDYHEPERKVAVVRGEKTWFYVAEDEQLLRGRIDGSELLLRLLAGETPLEQMFQVEPLESPDDRGEGGSPRLKLVPRDGELESFQQVVLRLAAPDASIDEAEVVDVAGNRVVYRFHGLRRNEGLRAGIFHFEPPEGTVILGQH